MSRPLMVAVPATLALLLAAGACLPCWGVPADAEGGESAQATNPLGPNAACYVCHMTFVREELSRTHLKAKVTCIKCHGLSAKHANDEDIGATKPRRIYSRSKIDAMCRKCHKSHDVPPDDVIARWLERELDQSPPVCTDCHGSHRIDRPQPTDE